MYRVTAIAAACSLLGHTLSVSAQQPVVAASDPETLWHSHDSVLNSNKQAAYHIVKDLLTANHWELASKYIADDYIQHNPKAKNGLAAVVEYFTHTLHRQPSPIPAKLTAPIVSVTAEGDKVVVAYVVEAHDPQRSARTYTTTSFDMWRFKDGKAVEHWDTETVEN